MAAANGPSDLRKRAVTFAIVFPAVIAALMYHMIRVPLGVGVACLAIDEYHLTTRGGLVTVWSRGLNVLGAVLMCLSASFLSYQAFVFCYTMVIGFAFINGMVRHSIRANNVIEETFRRLCADMFGQFYVSFLWAHVFLLANKPYATAILVYIILVTSMGEHGGFFVGSFFGAKATKVVPFLSPKKSVEGFVGNLAASTVTSYVLGFFWVGSIPIPLEHYWSLGLALGIFGITGDLFESFVKRAFKKKDMADLLPGWGGVLDRIDGLLLNFALMHYVIAFFYE